MITWVIQNWFDLLSSIGIIASLLFTAFALHSETKTRRIANLLSITANHREIWKQVLHSPALIRVIDPKADVAKEPVTPVEEQFVGLVIAHVNSVYYASHDSLVIKWEGGPLDIAQFLSLPVPKAVWSKTKLLQNLDFAAYIESSLKQP